MIPVRSPLALLVTMGVLLAGHALDPLVVQAQGRGGGAAPDDSARDPLATALEDIRIRSIGPAVVSGRIADVAIHPSEPNTWYIATASGGMWKTTNAGTTFAPIMDREGTYSFGAVTIDPNKTNVVWAGAGENNAQRAIAYGDGVYKSVDAGRTWRNVGLPESEHIAKVLVDPRNSDVVYVAAQGPLYRAGGDRGLFKTTDGGKTWANVLESGEWGGVTDVVMDPRNPDVLIAATWQRARRQWGSVQGGPASGLHRSVDGGATWTRAEGLPRVELGRIGLAISPLDGDVVYAIVEAAADSSGFYRSENNGINWRRMSDRTTSGNYYSEIFADPVHVNRVYSADTRTAVTNDGGRTWESVGLTERHVDDHLVWIDPRNPQHLLIGGDGGLYQTFDGGETWDWFQNLPLGQFYRVDVDDLQPFYRVAGGTQDNSSFIGPSRTLTRQGADNGDWILTQGGDGFYSRMDPTDPNIIYAESQYAGLSRFNLATGEEVAITPLAEPGEPDLRWHWDAPLVLSPHSPTRLYFAAQRVFRSDDRGSSWTPISGDLTAQIDRNRLKIMGRVWSVDAIAKNASTSTWNSIVAMEESRLKEGLLWIGTDDGVIQVTEDGGANWRRIGPIRGVPDTTFISRVTPSRHDVNTVYVAFDNHKAGDYRPYVAKSTDLGRSWQLISGNLPARGSVFVVLEDHINPNMLFAGTEFGVYVTLDGGRNWVRMRGPRRGGFPTVKVTDMVLQTRHDDLAIATFGRGFYIVDDLETLRGLTPDVLARDGLMPVQPAPLYVQSTPDPDWQGGRFWTAPNPDAGATIYYHVRESLRTRADARQRAERRAARAGQDVYYPPWDSLRTEDREEAPSMILTITDEEGRVVRRLTGRASAGLQRATWDLRFPSAAPVRTTAPARGFGGFFGGGGGPYVAPGTYTVTLAKRVDGVETPVGDPQRFEVYALLGDRTPRSPAVVAFQQDAARLQRAMLGAGAAITEARGRIELLERALRDTPNDISALRNDLTALKRDLTDLEYQLSGDPTMSRRNEPTPPSLQSRLGRFTGGAWSGSLQEVTGEQRKQYDIVTGQFGAVLDRLRALVGVELGRIEQAAEAAGAPWTSGRIPTWKP